jgi:hypothetical protein
MYARDLANIAISSPEVLRFNSPAYYDLRMQSAVNSSLGDGPLIGT